MLLRSLEQREITSGLGRMKEGDDFTDKVKKWSWAVENEEDFFSLNMSNLSK